MFAINVALSPAALLLVRLVAPPDIGRESGKPSVLLRDSDILGSWFSSALANAGDDGAAQRDAGLPIVAAGCALGPGRAVRRQWPHAYEEDFRDTDG